MDTSTNQHCAKCNAVIGIAHGKAYYEENGENICIDCKVAKPAKTLKLLSEHVTFEFRGKTYQSTKANFESIRYLLRRIEEFTLDGDSDVNRLAYSQAKVAQFTQTINDILATCEGR